MNTFTKLAVCAISFAGVALASAETVNFAAPGALRKIIGNNNIVVANDQVTANGRTFIISTKVFDVDPAKKYTLKLTMTAKGKKAPQMYIGYNILDAKGRAYPAICWQGLEDSFTQVTRAAKKGDTVIYVKDGSKWTVSPILAIALNAKQDNSDIPNTKIVRNTVASKVQKGDEWEITLTAPLKADIPAGTNVRQHADGGYYYNIARAVPVGKETTLTGSVQGFAAKAGRFNGRNWPVNAKKVVFLMLSDWTNAGAEITFKDFTLTIE